MRSSWFRLLVGAGLAASLGTVSATPAHPAAPLRDIPPGILVEGIKPGGGKTEIRAGDSILSWEARPNVDSGARVAGETIQTPFDLDEMEREWAPRGAVFLTLDREGELFRVKIPAQGLWLRLLPRLPEMDRACLTEGRRLSDSKDFTGAASRWRDAARAAGLRGDPLAASWLLLTAGSFLADARQWEAALGDYDAALAAAREADHPYAPVKILSAQGFAFRKLERFDEAEAAYREAIALREEEAGKSLIGANMLHSLGLVAQERGDLDAAEALYKESLAISTLLAPGCLQAAGTLNNLGVLATKRADLDSAERFYHEAIAIRERSDPESLELAQALNNIGTIARRRGDLAAAEGHYGRSLTLFERLGTRGLNLATIWNNLGTVALHRGNLIKSEECFRKALAILESEPAAPLRAAVLHNLGTIARARGDLDSAAAYYEKALALKKAIAADDLSVSMTLGNLGVVAEERLDFKRAAEFYNRALELQEKVAPGSLPSASTLNNLGQVAFDEGDPAAAEAYFRRSLAIKEQLAPGSLDVATTLKALAILAADRGDLVGAEAMQRRCLAICQELAPGTAQEAEALRDLGTVAEAKGDSGAALDYFTRAVEALETQRRKLGGGSEASQSFSATYADTFRNLVRLQLLKGLKKDAFLTLERFRARTLLELLAERDLDFSKDAPAEILREQKRADHDYAGLQDQLAELNPARDEAAIREALGKLREARSRQVEATEKIRRASPKLAGLEYPRPLDLAGAMRTLPPDSLLLSYCVGSGATHLLALQRGRLRVEEIPVERKTLARKVRLLRETLRDPGQAEITSKVAAELFTLLVAPVQDLLGKARVVLLCPDGPLHALPFSALRDGSGRFLSERAALSTILSVTLLSEVAAEGGTTLPTRLAAFGDPAIPEGGLSLRGMELKPLPGTRQEVESLKEIYPSQSEVWLGAEATAERALALGKEPTLVHFACHGMADEHRPLDSALVLSPTGTGGMGRESGLLQAWEIFESMRIRADLVTLSACETGLGKEMGGEGMVGLTRAFQYAGARCVLSSLWKVPDESTARLMRSFYGHLKRGKSKPEALRLAQIDMIRTGKGIKTEAGGLGEEQIVVPPKTSPNLPAQGATPPSSPGALAFTQSSALSTQHSDYSHPFHWAGFVLYGPEK